MTVQLLQPACRRHRATLLALVDRQERSPATDVALDHLATCGRCQSELTRLTLTIHALRRIGAEAATANASEAVWARLRAQVERSRRRARQLAWQWRMNAAGLIAATLIVGLTVRPLALSGVASEPTFFNASEAERVTSQEEATFIIEAGEARILAARRDVPSSVPARRFEGNGIQPEWKEVDSSDTGGVVPRPN